MQSSSQDGSRSGHGARGLSPSANSAQGVSAEPVLQQDPEIGESVPTSLSQEESQLPSERPDDIICCPCGSDEETPEMVCCDQCNTWQHFSCVGLNSDSKQVRDESAAYICPSCVADGNAGSDYAPRSAEFEPAWRQQGSHIPLPQGQPPMLRFTGREIPDSEELLPSAASEAQTSDDVFAPTRTPKGSRKPVARAQPLPSSDEDDLPTDPRQFLPQPDDEESREDDKRPKKRVRKLSTNLKTLYSEPGTADEASTLSLQPLDEVVAEDARVTRNVRRWNQAIGPEGRGIKLLKVVLPTKMKGRLDFMRDLLRAPVVDDRQLFIESCVSPKGSKYWHFMVKNNNTPDIPALKVIGTFYNKTTLPTKQAALTVGDKLCRYLERLPAPLAIANATNNRPSAMAALLQVAVFSDIYGETDWVTRVIRDLNGLPIGFHAVHTQTSGGIARTTGDVPVITDKGEKGAFREQNLNIQVDINKFDMNVDAPEIDTDLAALWPGLFDKAHLASKKLPNQQHDQYIRAAQIVRYVQTKMYGAIGTWQDIQKLKDRFIHPFLLEKYKSNKEGLEIWKPVGPYNNKKLVYFNPVPVNKEFVIGPGQHLAQDVDGELPRIRIKTGSRTRISFVIETLMTQFYTTCDILQAWRTSCECADRISASLISSEDIKLQYCQCSEEERSTTVHICQLCLTAELCCDMSRNESECLICNKCTTNTSMADNFGAAPGEKLRFRLKALVYADKSIDLEDRESVFEEIWAHLQQFCTPEGQWQDHWAATVRDEYIESGRAKRTHPLAISFDAIHPFSVMGDRVLYHANPTNICLTAAFLNRLKGLYFPVLGYMHMAEEMRNTSVTKDYDQLIDQCDHLYVMTCKYVFSAKTRRGGLDVKAARALINDMKFPIADQQEANHVFHETLGHHYGRRDNALWFEEDQTMINHIIGQCETRFSRSVQRGSDGAPWLWIPFHMPPDWSWLQLWYEMAGRVQRMRELCNAKWETVDNTVTLLLEIVYQHLKNDGRDNFFGLPMTIYKKHPLIYSIGHRHHGSQMRTGFKTLYPQNLDDDFDESLSNILVETHLSNYVKWDHLESEYDIIHDAMRSVHLETEYYGVPNHCHRFDFTQVFAKKGGMAKSIDSGPEESDESDNDWTEE